MVEISFIDRHSLKYAENGRSLIVEIEQGFREPILHDISASLPLKPHVILYTASIRAWSPPNEDEEITDEKKQHIVKEICVWLARQNLDVEVE